MINTSHGNLSLASSIQRLYERQVRFTASHRTATPSHGHLLMIKLHVGEHEHIPEEVSVTPIHHLKHLRRCRGVEWMPPADVLLFADDFGDGLAQ